MPCQRVVQLTFARADGVEYALRCDFIARAQSGEGCQSPCCTTGAAARAFRRTRGGQEEYACTRPRDSPPGEHFPPSRFRRAGHTAASPESTKRFLPCGCLQDEREVWRADHGEVQVHPVQRPGRGARRGLLTARRAARPCVRPPRPAGQRAQPPRRPAWQRVRPDRAA